MNWKNWLVLGLIILLATFLRLYRLGEVPPSLDWDEASLGWNAYSILKTGTDEYGKAFPVSIRSFNDYKPPLYVYAAIPGIAVFGLNEFSVRLPSALAGILTVLITYFLVKEMFVIARSATTKQSEKIATLASFARNDTFALLTTLLVAISPWSLQFSRGAFEANLALFFFVSGGLLLIKFLNSQRSIWFLASGVLYIASIYSYHSPRLVVPAFLFLIFIFYRKIFLAHFKSLFLISCFLLLFLYPLARNTLHVGSVTARLNTVQIVSSPGEFVTNYFSHYNFDYFFLNGDGNQRHHVPDFGLLYLVESPFLLAGLYFLVKNRPRWWPFLASWLAVAPLASSLAIPSPHAIRSLLFLPTLQIVIAYGLINILTKKVFIFAVSSLYILNFTFYIHQYFVHFPIESAAAWQYGYKQAVKKVLTLENKYDSIYFTNTYDQAYIYFLFYGRISPIVKNSGYFYKGLDKYQFSLKEIDPKGLYIIAPADKVPGFKAFDTVYFPDGTPAFLFGTIASS